jgi:hypothetical protein
VGPIVATVALIVCFQGVARAGAAGPEPEYGHLFTVTPDPLVPGGPARFRIELFEFSTAVDDLHVTLDSLSPALRLRRHSAPRWKLAPVSAAQAENAFRQVSMHLRVSSRARAGSHACIAFTIHADNGGSASDHHVRRCYFVARHRRRARG